MGTSGHRKKAEYTNIEELLLKTNKKNTLISKILLRLES